MSNRKTNEEFQEELKGLREQGYDIYSDDKYINNHTKIWFYCSNGHRWPSRPNDILRGHGCPYCSNRKVLIGYNDIATTNPDMLKFLANSDDGYKYTKWSNININFKCPLCGSTQNRKIASVSYRGFKCEYCGNGISYPNKFGRAFFDQLPIEKYIAEYHPKWGKPYIYDIYFNINEKEYLVEWDGSQHSEDRNPFGVSLTEYQTIDKIKNKLAQENGLHLIRIDCAKSECDYIKNNIKRSDLGSLFDLSKIDWTLCDERAQKNLVKMVCDLWMSGINSFDTLAEKLHLSNSTVRDYINRGTRLGWCNYDSKQWITERRRPIYIINILSNQKYYFESIKACANGSVDICGHRVAEETIVKYCKNGLAYKGFLFKYANITV